MRAFFYQSIPSFESRKLLSKAEHPGELGAGLHALEIADQARVQLLVEALVDVGGDVARTARTGSVGLEVTPVIGDEALVVAARLEVSLLKAAQQSADRTFLTIVECDDRLTLFGATASLGLASRVKQPDFATSTT